MVAALVGMLLLAGGCLALALSLGLPLWMALARRRPEPAELLGHAFFLGLPPLTLVAYGLVLGGQAEGPVPALAAVGMLLVGLAAVVRSRAAREAIVRPGAATLAGIRRLPLWWLAVLPIALAGLLTCSVPATAWDACTYHYGLVEHFRRSRTLAPQGASVFELFHLNAELLNAFWMGVAGERAANVFSLVQVFSLAAVTYGAIRRCAEPFWSAAGALLVLTLPIVVHESTGGCVDTLLVQSALLAYLCYERGLAEPRRRGWAVMAGLFAGYAWGIKQSAPALLLPLALLALGDLARRRERRGLVLLFAATGLLVALPWVARTWQATGNPLWPAFPQLTTVASTPDHSRVAGRPEPLPWGFFVMLFEHTHPKRMLGTAIPPGVVALLLAGLIAFAARRPGGGTLRRMWIVVLVSCGVAYCFFPAGTSAPRFALFAYVFALIPALISLSAVARPAPWMRRLVVGTCLLSLALGLVVAGGRVWRRREVLMGVVTPERYITGVYPHLALLEAVRPRIAPGDALLVFDSLTYRNGLPTYDADARYPGPAVVDWSRSTPEAILANCRQRGIRWALVPFGTWPYRAGVELWAAGELDTAALTEAQMKACLRREFPEWVWPDSPLLRPPAHRARFAQVVEQWREMRRWMVPAGSLPGLTLYELKLPPQALAGTSSTGHSRITER